MASLKPVRTAAFTTLGEKRLYIVAGFQAPLPTGDPTAPGVNQFASLDLTVPTWNANNPPWTIHSQLPFTPGVYPFFAVLPKSQAQLIVACGDDGPATVPVATFDLGSNSWSLGSAFATSYTGSSGVLAAVNPTIDTIIVPTGSTMSTSQDYGTFLYNIATKESSVVPGPEMVGPQVPATLREYAIAWSSVRGTVLVYGGRGQLPGNRWQYSSSLLEFSSTTRTWKELTVSGPSPGGSNWGCLVPAYNGQKMVLFGGFTRDMLTPSIYILDVAKLEWEKGQDIDVNLQRYEHVCTAAGDSFVAWGGLNSANSSTTFKDPVIYDLKAGRWTDQFALTSPSTPTTPSTSTTPSKDVSTPPPVPPAGQSDDGSSSNTGAIAGSVAGVVVVLLVVGLFLFKRRRRRQSQEHDSLPTKNIESNKAGHLSDLNSMPPPPPPPPSEPWSNDYPPLPRNAQTTMAAETSAMASGTSSPSTTFFAATASHPSSPSTTLFAATASHPSSPPLASFQEPRNPHVQKHQPPLNPQEYPADPTPQGYFPPPPVPQRPRGPSTYDSSLNNFDILPSSSSSPPMSADSYQAHHEKVYEAPPRVEQPPQVRNPQQREETDLERRLRIEQQEKVYEASPRVEQPPQVRNPQQREETDLERRLRIEQQEIEQLELAHLIQLKKLKMERLLEEQRAQSQSSHDRSRD
ncbi:hypothetical protein BGZ97_004663 [Linnemannia gamsii]|uniref:Galactose oxidase n=1 Tax=Linnemannia gamsii TaxID=64522 RepID=A0A9P6QTD2_9FUNG|nr:hypothetical protein BGZ97_004663 [Linnemannia gamsii]